MASPLDLVLLVLHIAAAASLLGVGLASPRLLRSAIGTGREAKALVAAAVAKGSQLGGIMALVTLATGLALVFHRGGFKVVAPSIHAAMGLLVLAIVFSFFFVRPVTQALVAAADKDDAAWSAARKRYLMGDGILNVVWLVILVLMFVK